MKQSRKEIIKEKAHLFFTRKVKIHISTYMGETYNGSIIAPHHSSFELDDDKEGKKEFVYSEVHRLTEFKVKSNTNPKNRCNRKKSKNLGEGGKSSFL